MRPITERYANVSFGGKTLNRLLVYLNGRGFSLDTLEMSSNNSQVLGFPCFGKSIDSQWDLFRQSSAGVGNSISW